jgi:hypothetical protein
LAKLPPTCQWRGDIWSIGEFQPQKEPLYQPGSERGECESKGETEGKATAEVSTTDQSDRHPVVTRLRHRSRMQRELQIVYGSLSSPKTSLPEDLNDIQTELVAALLDEGHFKFYPPSIEYQKAFWRHVILSIENSGNVSGCAQEAFCRNVDNINGADLVRLRK